MILKNVADEALFEVNELAHNPVFTSRTKFDYVEHYGRDSKKIVCNKHQSLVFCLSSLCLLMNLGLRITLRGFC